MSHYTVGVIIKKENLTDLTDLRFCVEEALKPFDENLEVEPHEISESSKERLKEWYNHYMESREKKVSLLDFAKENGYIIKTGGVICTTYNSNSKWDWYEIGGRWSNNIPLKNGEHSNFAKIKDIKWTIELSEKDKEELKTSYNKSKEENPLFEISYPTLEDFIKDYENFATYALLLSDGTWLEPGKMGWFGISDAEEEEKEKFQNKYLEKIKEQDGEDYFVLVDLHI